ncbi:hypothetical protein [Candidatus Neoehrlichia procyonis]|uniref:Uncharacterized protein n=1 Tax=Candidatus Neoehrlichia procyonis str. RAC413 TaxID=1359163 RepID=A0A0F3NL60_9RICK|nr:hypothetical protein [Candidatus Neoehrlichia lotoris]KJV68770.1 hypothetical protein NLO413_0134 [Candidatus Neoehrlichia lotoris str. RAC413]
MRTINKQGVIYVSNLLTIIMGSEIFVASRKVRDNKCAVLICTFSTSVLALVLLQIYYMFFHRKVYIVLKNKKELFILDAPLLKIEVYSTKHSHNACSTLQVTLDKKLIDGYSTNNAERQILIQKCTSNPLNSINAQIKICFINKPGSVKIRIIPLTSLDVKPNIVINVKEKKYTKYSILHLQSVILSVNDLEKILNLCVCGKSIYLLLLEKYLSENYDNDHINNKLLYILKNFPCSNYYQSLLSNELESNLCNALKYLRKYNAIKLTKDDLEILTEDIMDLMIKRAHEYKNLHEVLYKEEYIKEFNLQIGNEDIIACYFDALNNVTSNLIKKYLLCNNSQIKIISALHSYITKCKECNENRFKDLRTLYFTDEIKIGYEILSNFINEHNLSDNIDHIIYVARSEVSKKYSKLLNNCIIGLVKEETASISRLKLSKGKAFNVQKLSSNYISHCI